MRKSLVSMLLLFMLGSSFAETPKSTSEKKPMPDVFYVYKDRGSRENHYIPAGWMGDYGDMKMNQGYVVDLDKKNYCIKITCSMERKQGSGWSGIYWQFPALNWGDKRGGYDLSKYSKLKFLARGENGGELIDKFGVGGITGQTEQGDSDNTEIDAIELTKDWKEYTIDLKGMDLSHIIGGFIFAVNDDNNDNKPLSFYLDEVRFEK